MQPAIHLTVTAAITAPRRKEASTKHPIERLLETRIRQDLGTMQMVKMAAGEEGNILDMLFGSGGRGAMTGGLGLGGIALLLGLLGGKQNPIQSALPLALIGTLLGYGGSHLYRNRGSIFGYPEGTKYVGDNYAKSAPPLTTKPVVLEDEEFGPPTAEQALLSRVKADQESKRTNAEPFSYDWFSDKLGGESPEDQVAAAERQVFRNRVASKPWQQTALPSLIKAQWLRGVDESPDIPLTPRWMEQLVGGVRGLVTPGPVGDAQGPKTLGDPRIMEAVGRPASGWASPSEYETAQRSLQASTSSPPAAPPIASRGSLQLNPAAGPMEGLTDRPTTQPAAAPSRKPQENVVPLPERKPQIPPPVFPTAAR